jgi:hypothetical protein
VYLEIDGIQQHNNNNNNNNNNTAAVVEKVTLGVAPSLTALAATTEGSERYQFLKIGRLKVK